MIDSVGFDAAAAVGIAAFCAGEEPPSDEEVWGRLTGAGVEPWLAERLLILLPMAYTRRLLPAVTFSDALVSPDGRVNVSAEPVFVAALARAVLADRGEIERIALRSSEFNAINAALTAGSQLSDLMLGETAVIQDLEPVKPGDGGVPSPRAVFEGLLRGHDVVLDGKTAIDAELFVQQAPAGVVMVQVDFSVVHPALAGPRLVESFAGHGATWREAIGRAVNMFERGALHPIVEGLLRPGAAADQVERERYEHPDGAFDLVLGAQLNLFADQPVPPAGPLLDRLLKALCAEHLSRRVHGLRLFIAYQDGRLHTNEVLLDSETWPAGEAVVADSQAPLPDGMVAGRNASGTGSSDIKIVMLCRLFQWRIAGESVPGTSMRHGTLRLRLGSCIPVGRPRCSSQATAPGPARQGHLRRRHAIGMLPPLAGRCPADLERLQRDQQQLQAGPGAGPARSCATWRPATVGRGS